MALNGKNKWNSQEIKKKFLNKHVHTGNSSRSNCRMCSLWSWGTAWRVSNKRYWDQYCRNYAHSNDYYDDLNLETFDDNYNCKDGNAHYSDSNMYKPCLSYYEWKRTNETSVNTPPNSEILDTYDMSEYFKYKHSKTKEEFGSDQNSTKLKQQTIEPEKVQHFTPFEIEISVIGTKYNEYKYIKDRLPLNLEQNMFWTNVPIKLMNINVKHCQIKIINKDTESVELYQFAPATEVTHLFIPIYLTQYSFIYKNDHIPKVLQNINLFRLIKDCLSINPFAKTENIAFNKPLSIIPFGLSEILIECIPSLDVLENVLFPFIGYNNAIQIKTKVSGQNVIFPKRFKICTDDIHPLSYSHFQSLHSVKYKTKQTRSTHNNINKSRFETNQKYRSFINSLTSKYESKLSNPIPSEKVPKRKHSHYTLCDDDPDRNKKWWQNVNYKMKSKGKYKLNERVSVKYGKKDNWTEGMVIKIDDKGITVKYEEPPFPKRPWLTQQLIRKQQIVSKIRSLSSANRKTIYERKRKCYSKSNKLNY